MGFVVVEWQQAVDPAVGGSVEIKSCLIFMQNGPGMTPARCRTV
jgi:hypothetical protein